VGASRVRKALDLYHFGLLRRSDWLPVGGQVESEHTTRSADSISDSEDRDSEGSSEGERSSRTSDGEAMSQSSSDTECSEEEPNESDDDAFQSMSDRMKFEDHDEDEWSSLFDIQ